LEERKMKKLIVLLMVLGVTGIASAIDAVWDSGGGTDVSWTNAANWSANTLPVMGTSLTNGSLVKFYKTTGVAIGTLDGVGNAYQVKVGGPSSPAFDPTQHSTLTIAAGAVLNVGEYMMIGIDSPAGPRSGEIDMTGGTVNLGQIVATSGHLFLGHSYAGTQGLLNMSGGTINATGDFTISNGAGTTGIANLSGNATIYANQLKMNVSGTGTAMLDISGNAKLIINNNVTGTINNYKLSGLITANGDGYGDLRYDYNAATGKTTVYAVPEPATLCLLGLGALSLIRRNK
jgi:hypothetical protein